MTKRIDERSKRQKIDEIFLALKDHHDGLTQSELARIVRIGRSDVNKYLNKGDLPGIYEDNGRLYLERLGDLVRMLLSRDEITTLNIAMRLLARQTDIHSPEASAIVRKFSEVVNRTDTDVSQHFSQTAKQIESVDPAFNNELLINLRILTESRLKRRVVSLQYEYDDGALSKPVEFAPYFVEPYAPGLTTHVVGWRSDLSRLITYKLERLRNVKQGLRDFVMPDDFDPTALLKDAWGIWYTNAPPVLVVLKFSARVRRRVLETIWHRNQLPPEMLATGEVIWRCSIAEWREMLPWVRGWGGDLVVIEPVEMRREIEREVMKMAQVYGLGLQAQAMPKHYLFWAKTDRSKQAKFHLLICHMVDVGNVALAIWETNLPTEIKQKISNLLKLDVDQAGRFIAFLAALHDIGKACPSFQGHDNFRFTEAFKGQFELICKNYPFADKLDRCSHAFISTFILEELFQYEMKVDKNVASLFSFALGGHHGKFPNKNDILNLSESPSMIGNYPPADERWKNAWIALFQDIRRIFNPSIPQRLSLSIGTKNYLLSFVAGLISVADWLGSIDKRFGHTEILEDPDRLNDYAEDSYQKALKVLTDFRWTEWQPPQDKADFAKLFEITTPYPAQQQIIDLVGGFTEPAMVIIEDPTGRGKSESGLYIADYLSWKLQNRGLYIAMPTKATSNEMCKRLNQMLERRYGKHIRSLLVHGHARWLTPTGDEADKPHEKEKINWFAENRKQSLLSSFGVGTVDQSFMSVLQVNHYFVRLFALSGKTIIFDEVHAYDTYMSTIFERLLMWLRIIGASVVILSATLPNAQRRKFLHAYTGKEVSTTHCSYPRVSWGFQNGNSNAMSLVLPDEKPEIQLGWIDQSPVEIAIKLSELMLEGGCVAVICNRIARAQEIYDEVCRLNQMNPWLNEKDILLFHARFPIGWRNEIENDTKNRFGKDTTNPRLPSLIIATQVIEQSLDLDFDFMITDHAPIDLLIQRAGRLHRHKAKRDVYRPERLKLPQLLIARSVSEEDIPDFGNDALIYNRWTLLRSYWEVDQLILNSQPLAPMHKLGDREITETERLVEVVYPDIPIEAAPDCAIFPEIWKEALLVAWGEMRQDQKVAENEARNNLIFEPKNDLLMASPKSLSEDEETFHKSMRALTRKQKLPTTQIVCAFETANGLSLDMTGQVLLNLQKKDEKDKPNDDETCEIIQNSVQISGWTVWQYFRNIDTPQRWQNHSLLQNYRLARFEKGNGKWICDIDNNIFLEIDTKRGVLIHKKIDSFTLIDEE